MHLNHKPGEIMQVDWAGDTASVIDTVTGEIIPAYLFVASLPYSGYAYVEAFFSMNQETRLRVARISRQKQTAARERLPVIVMRCQTFSASYRG